MSNETYKGEGQRMRLATFDFVGVDLDDELAMEKAWNDFVDCLRFRGLRPADTAHSWTDTSMTYRVFDVVLEEEQETFMLDFDIAKLGKVATSIVLVGAFLSAALDNFGWATEALAGVVA